MAFAIVSPNLRCGSPLGRGPFTDGAASGLARHGSRLGPAGSGRLDASRRSGRGGRRFGRGAVSPRAPPKKPHGGLGRRGEASGPLGFVNLFATRILLADTHPLLALLLVSFSSEDEQASVEWRIAVDDGSVIGKTVVGKAEGTRRPLTVYGVSSPLLAGEHTVRIQVSSDRPTALAIRPLASSTDSLRLIVFELL